MEEFYKKKIIRGFLSLFSESKWKNLCILCLEYGILQLKKNYNISSLSLEDIEQYVDELLEEEQKNQKKNLRKLDPKCQSSNSSIIANTTNKPSSNWRKGDTKTIFDVDETNTIKNNQTDIKQNNNEESIYNYSCTEVNRNMDNTFSTCNEASIISRMNKEKILDDILYPKQQNVVNYRKDNQVFGSSKKNSKNNYATTYSNNYNSKKLTKNNFYGSSNSNKYSGNRNKNNTNLRRTYSSNKNLSGSSSNSSMKFNSGLQMLKMVAPQNRNIRSTSKNRGDDRKFNNVPSRIKSQIQADKKIYEMMKKQKVGEYTNNNRQNFDGMESTISCKKSEMSFEDGFSLY